MTDYPGLQQVQGDCPSCGWRSLFLGDGGYVTCSNLHCANPCAASEALGIQFPDPRPQPSDGPEYHHDLAAWKQRHPEAS